MQERITIIIETGNAAFEDSPTGEISRILRDIAYKFENDGIPNPYIFDVNGNRCGTIRIEELIA